MRIIPVFTVRSGGIVRWGPSHKALHTHSSPRRASFAIMDRHVQTVYIANADPCIDREY